MPKRIDVPGTYHNCAFYGLASHLLTTGDETLPDELFVPSEHNPEYLARLLAHIPSFETFNQFFADTAVIWRKNPKKGEGLPEERQREGEAVDKLLLAGFLMRGRHQALLLSAQAKLAAGVGLEGKELELSDQTFEYFISMIVNSAMLHNMVKDDVSMKQFLLGSEHGNHYQVFFDDWASKKNKGFDRAKFSDIVERYQVATPDTQADILQELKDCMREYWQQTGMERYARHVGTLQIKLSENDLQPFFQYMGVSASIFRHDQPTPESPEGLNIFVNGVEGHYYVLLNEAHVFTKALEADTVVYRAQRERVGKVSNKHGLSQSSPLLFIEAQLENQGGNYDADPAGAILDRVEYLIDPDHKEIARGALESTTFDSTDTRFSLTLMHKTEVASPAGGTEPSAPVSSGPISSTPDPTVRQFLRLLDATMTSDESVDVTNLMNCMKPDSMTTMVRQSGLSHCASVLKTLVTDSAIPPAIKLVLNHKIMSIQSFGTGIFGESQESINQFKSLYFYLLYKVITTEDVNDFQKYMKYLQQLSHRLVNPTSQSWKKVAGLCFAMTGIILTAGLLGWISFGILAITGLTLSSVAGGLALFASHKLNSASSAPHDVIATLVPNFSMKTLLNYMFGCQDGWTIHPREDGSGIDAKAKISGSFSGPATSDLHETDYQRFQRLVKGTSMGIEYTPSTNHGCGFRFMSSHILKEVTLKNITPKKLMALYHQLQAKGELVQSSKDDDRPPSLAAPLEPPSLFSQPKGGDDFDIDFEIEPLF